uniref:Ankyrin repeat-containing protein n=1 Tax=Borely moumouvirus TaxID=2712067 RepID=A0A6G6ADE9_9VIRU
MNYTSRIGNEECNNAWKEIISLGISNNDKFLDLLHKISIDSVNNIIHRLYYSGCFSDYLDITLGEFLNGNIKPNDNTVFVAAECGLIKYIEIFRDLDYDIKTKSTYPNAVLKIACKFGRMEMIEWLIKNDFDINFDPELFSVLCYHNDINVCKLLLKLGFDIDTTRPEVQETLIYILKNKKMDLIKLLLKYNVNFNHITNYLNNLSANEDNKKIINILIGNGLTFEDILKIFM